MIIRRVSMTEMRILVIMKVLATITIKVTVLIMTYGRNSIGRKGCKEIM